VQHATPDALRVFLSGRPGDLAALDATTARLTGAGYAVATPTYARPHDADDLIHMVREDDAALRAADVCAVLPGATGDWHLSARMYGIPACRADLLLSPALLAVAR
jgi:hypothetical protein